jgi:hypothetical protein
MDVKPIRIFISGLLSFPFAVTGWDFQNKKPETSKLKGLCDPVSINSGKVIKEIERFFGEVSGNFGQFSG